VDRPVTQPFMGARQQLVVLTPWCAHKHTPRPRPKRSDLLGEFPRLRCEGSEAGCQVAQEVRGDLG
jgi:hypothetical protein